ncbi:hypothetical protein HMPREF3150_04985 [Pseudomonas aeruginosa]|nr:hypothetical protein HMPREF3150_04985 [Pseudomonas aeruginosa]
MPGDAFRWNCRGRLAVASRRRTTRCREVLFHFSRFFMKYAS